MAKISTYIIDSTPQLTDKVIGTDVNDNDITKNYLIQDIVDLVPPPPAPTLTPTKMIYGDANSLYAETDKLTYIVGGLGSVQEDTVVIGGTMSITASSINDSASTEIGADINPNKIGSVVLGQSIIENGTATMASCTFMGNLIGDDASAANSVHVFGQDILRKADDIGNIIAMGRGNLTTTTGTVRGVICLGHSTLVDNLTTCEDSIVLGDFAVQASELSETIAIGKSTLQQPDDVNQSVVIGVEAGKDINFSGASQTSVSECVIIGNAAGVRCGDASLTSNVFIGPFAAANVNQSTSNVNSNSDNVIIGSRAGLNLGLSNFNGQPVEYNVLIGYRAGYAGANNNGQSYQQNIYIGSDAGAEAVGVGNIGIGQNANAAANLGFYNTALGVNALQSQQGGDFNVAIGNDALQQLQTATNNTAIGKAAGSTVVGFSNTTNLGHNAQAQGDNEVVLGDNNVGVLRCNTQIISGLSDIRDKDNVEELDLGLDFLMELEPVSWDWDRRDGTMKGQKGSGFIAQEVDEVIQANEAEDILPMVNKRNPDAWEVGNAALIPVLVKAIQELKAELDACKAEK